MTKVLGATKSAAGAHLTAKLGKAPNWEISRDVSDGAVRSSTTMCTYKNLKIGKVNGSLNVLLEPKNARVDSVNLNVQEGKLSWQNLFDAMGLKTNGVKVTVLVQMDGMKITRFTQVPGTPKGFNARLMQRKGVMDSLTFALK